MGMKYALFISTYNVDTRKNMYKDVIRWWMKNSSFDIYIVDSSNNQFDNDIESMCKIHHFNQVDHTKTKGCSTTLELLSFKQAFSVFGTEWETNYDYIIKLTGKYTLPCLEKNLQDVRNTTTEMFVQSRYNKSHTNTELLIIKSTKFETIMDEIRSVTPHCCLEKRLQTILGNHIFKRLKKIPNNSHYKRGAGDMLTWL